MNLVPLKNLVIDFGILYINKVVSNRKKKKEKQSLTNIYGHTHNLEYEKASTALKLVCIPMGM